MRTLMTKDNNDEKKKKKNIGDVVFRDLFCMHPANARRRYNVTSSLIGWAHTQNNPCVISRFMSKKSLWYDYKEHILWKGE